MLNPHPGTKVFLQWFLRKEELHLSSERKIIVTTARNAQAPLSHTALDEQPPSSRKSRRQRGLIWLLAVACTALAANIYYIQPLLVVIARSFAVPESQIGLIVTATQLGFAFGLLLLVPLGDAFDRR